MLLSHMAENICASRCDGSESCTCSGEGADASDSDEDESDSSSKFSINLLPREESVYGH